MTLKSYLTVADVAERLGLSRGRIRQLLIAGRITGRKHGSAWMISHAEVRRFQKLDRPPGNPTFGK